MTPYRNLSGDSGVVAYELRESAIVVRFRNGDAYLYSHRRPGRTDVERMKHLAVAGRGLSGYIATEVRDRYEDKL